MISITLTFFLAKMLITSFEYCENNPTALFPYYYAVDDYSTGSISNPAYLPLLNYSYINTSYCKPYSMRDLNSSSVRLGQGLGSAGYQFSWSRFGIDEYREDILECNIGYKPVKRLLTGLGISNYRLYINSEDLNIKQDLFDFRASLIFIPFTWIDLGFQQENIHSLIDEKRKDILYPSSSFGIKLKPADGISLIWNINKVYYGYINSFSISTNLLRYFNIKAGYSRETTTYSASITIIYKLINISYGLRHHPYLGSTHCFGVSISSMALSLEKVNYSKRLYSGKAQRSINKIDINSCSIEDLKRVPVLPEGIAERIIKYKNVIGPISKKSLLQIGISSKEIKSLQRYVYGFTTDVIGKKQMNEKKYYRNRKNYRRMVRLTSRRRLFKRLIESGIKASIALRISELAGEMNKRSLANKIDKLSEISKENKRLILKICTDTL